MLWIILHASKKREIVILLQRSNVSKSARSTSVDVNRFYRSQPQHQNQHQNLKWHKINIEAVTVPVVSGIRVGCISVTAQVFIAVVTLWIVKKWLLTVIAHIIETRLRKTSQKYRNHIRKLTDCTWVAIECPRVSWQMLCIYLHTGSWTDRQKMIITRVDSSQ